MRKQPEPLNELFLQQFPKKDPIELEQMIQTVEKWLEQQRTFYEKASRLTKKHMGEHAQSTIITIGYVHCVNDLLNQIDPSKYPIKT